MSEILAEAIILNDNAVLAIFAVSVKKKEINTIGWMIIVWIKLLKIVSDRELCL